MPETQQTPDIAEKMKMLDFEQTKAKANLEAAKGTIANTENGASAATQEDEKSGYVTVNENGGVLVFGEPLGVDSVDLGVGGEKILVEIDKDESRKVVEAIKGVLMSDIKSGKDWDDFGGLVVNPQVLRHLVNLGVVTKEQVLNAVSDNDRKKLTTEFSAYPFHEVFSDTEPAVSENHPFFERKLVIMTPDEIEATYGSAYRLVTIDKEEKSL